MRNIFIVAFIHGQCYDIVRAQVNYPNLRRVLQFKEQMQIDRRYTIETEAFSVKLTKTYPKIITLLPAPNSTFVFLGIIGTQTDALVHVDAQGNVLFQHKFSRQVDSIGMVAADEVIALEPKRNQITIVDLNTHEVRELGFQFMNEESDQSSLYTFTDSKYVCVVQNGRYNDNRFKLSYFASPLNKASKPIHVYESDLQWNYQYQLKKGNQDSMILWFKPRQDKEFELKAYDLNVSALKGGFSHYRIKNQIGTPYNCNTEIQLALVNAWEIKPDSFCLVCNSEKTSLGLKNSSGCVNNNFIWNVRTNEIRQAHFWFDPKYNDYLIDIHSFGQFSIFRTYFFQKGIVEPSPCYYVHNQSEKIVAVDSWQCSYLVKFEYPGYDSVIVESEYQNSDVKGFKMRIKRIVEKKQ